MIKAKVSTDYKDIERIFAGGAIQKEIIKVWSTEADAYVFEAWKILEMEGPLPLTFNANGEPLIDYQIYGNTEQDGTPTPENPIIPIGCGERTENLLDESTLVKGFYNVIDGKIKIEPISSGSTVYRSFRQSFAPGTYTISFGNNIYLARAIVDGIVRENVSANISSYTVTTQTGDIGFSMRRATSSSTPWDNNPTMLNSGSTALPYEPYGCKLPILSNSTVTNIYLGEVEATRRLKKLVLTGEENWKFFANSDESIWQFYIENFASGLANLSAISNITEYGVTVYTRGLYDYGCFLVTDGKGIAFQMRGSKDTFVDVDTWKTYLAAQYAAGTPVTVLYVLAEPETGVVNEPLMKIGDYSDTVDSTQTNVQIPTDNGITIIDYDGGEKHVITSDGYVLVDKNQNGFLLSGSTLRPEKMYIKYKGR